MDSFGIPLFSSASYAVSSSSRWAGSGPSSAGGASASEVLLTHGRGFLLGYVKEGGVEHGDVVLDEVAASGVEGALLVRVRVVVGRGVEAVLGHRGPPGPL